VPPPKNPRLRVLVVDDEPLIRWSLSETLVDFGCETVEAADAEGAVQAVVDADKPFDVVVLDLRLPDSSDLGLLTRVRALAPSARVIMMTAFGSSEVVQGALDLGASHVVMKPFEVAEMAQLVARERRPTVV
jgi:two-component system response regulator AtoC